MKLGEKDSSIALFMRLLTRLKMSRMPVSGSVHFGTNKPGIASPIAFTLRVITVSHCGFTKEWSN